LSRPETKKKKTIFDAVASVLKHEDFGVTTDLMYAGLKLSLRHQGRGTDNRKHR